MPLTKRQEDFLLALAAEDVKRPGVYFPPGRIARLAGVEHPRAHIGAPSTMWALHRLGLVSSLYRPWVSGIRMGGADFAITQRGRDRVAEIVRDRR